jgi:hypothetical protein
MFITYNNDKFFVSYFQLHDDEEFLEQVGLQYIRTPLHLVVVNTRPDGTDVFKLDEDHVLYIEYSKVRHRITHIEMLRNQVYRGSLDDTSD